MKTETKVVSSTALLAAAAAAVSSQPAMAADLGPVPVAAPTWQGFYVGGHVGASWLSSVSDDSGYAVSSYAAFGYNFISPGTANTANAVGIIGGPQIGYNFQARNFVFGAEADFSFLGNSSATSHGNRQMSYTYGFGIGGTVTANVATTRTSSINQMATFRARFGLDFDGTMPFVTGGLALANIKNTYTTFGTNSYGFSGSQATSSTNWTPGLVVGVGVEHQFSSHWSLRGEILWVGFEDQTLNVIGVDGGGPAGTVKFMNSLVIGQLGLNYRF